VRHHERRRGVETLDQQPTLVIHRKRRGTTKHIMPLVPAPFCRGPEQSIGDALVIDGLEETEKAYPIAVSLVVEPVADSRNPTHNLIVPLGDEVLGLGVLEKRVPGARKEGGYVPTQRRDPERVPRMESVRKIDEPLEISSLARRSDAHAIGQMTPRSLPMMANCSSAKSICSNVCVAMRLVRRRH
jgi:hypothetical protein